MKNIVWLGLLLAATFTLPAPSQAKMPVPNKFNGHALSDGTFRASFPADLKHSSDTEDPAYRRYSAHGKGKTNPWFCVMIIEKRPGLASVADFARRVKHGHAKGAGHAFEMEGVHGYEFVGLDPDGVPTFSRFYSTPHHCYWVLGNSFNVADNEKFVKSFRFTAPVKEL
jgi:hypothetical protein